LLLNAFQQLAQQLLLKEPIVRRIVWISRAACRRCLFRTWKFWRFAYSQCGFNLFARWHQCLRFM